MLVSATNRDRKSTSATTAKPMNYPSLKIISNSVNTKVLNIGILKFSVDMINGDKLEVPEFILPSQFLLEKASGAITNIGLEKKTEKLESQVNEKMTAKPDNNSSSKKSGNIIPDKRKGVLQKLKSIPNNGPSFYKKTGTKTNYQEEIYNPNFEISDYKIREILPVLNAKLVDPLIKSNKHVYSFRNFHEFSFLYGQNKLGFIKKSGNLKTPAPTGIPAEDLTSGNCNLTKYDILKGMKISDQKGLVLVDKETMAYFRGMVSDMIKKIINRAFGGPPVSLNVKIFEPKSTLQRVCEYWSNAPLYLAQASDSNITTLKRLQLVVAFAISGLCVPAKQLKPFNPLLGETFQGCFEEYKTKVYAEQTGHYPTTARFLVKGSNYRVSCGIEFDTKTENLASVILILQKGEITVEFPALGEKIQYYMPIMRLENCKSEVDRNAYVSDSMQFVDCKNNLKCVVNFAKNPKKIHGFEGYVIEQNFDSNYVFRQEEEMKWLKKFDVNMQKYLKENDPKKKEKFNINNLAVTLSGSFLTHLNFDNKEYWSIEQSIPNIKPEIYSIPSDGRYREDLIWLYKSRKTNDPKEKQDYLDYAQESKVTIEEVQRRDRELRSAYLKKK